MKSRLQDLAEMVPNLLGKHANAPSNEKICCAESKGNGFPAKYRDQGNRLPVGLILEGLSRSHTSRSLPELILKNRNIDLAEQSTKEWSAISVKISLARKRDGCQGFPRNAGSVKLVSRTTW